MGFAVMPDPPDSLAGNAEVEAIRTAWMEIIRGCWIGVYTGGNTPVCVYDSETDQRLWGPGSYDGAEAFLQRRAANAVANMLRTASAIVSREAIETVEGRIESLQRQISEARAERDAWINTAAQHYRNEEFYHGLVTQIGRSFGVAARTSDDGSIQEDVLALKVPELIAEVRRQLSEARAETAKLIDHRKMMAEWQSQLAEYLGAPDGTTNAELLEMAERQRQWCSDKADELAEAVAALDGEKDDVTFWKHNAELRAKRITELNTELASATGATRMALAELDRLTQAANLPEAVLAPMREELVEFRRQLSASRAAEERMRAALKLCERAAAGCGYAWPKNEQAARLGGVETDDRLNRIGEIVRAALSPPAAETPRTGG